MDRKKVTIDVDRNSMTYNELYRLSMGSENFVLRIRINVESHTASSYARVEVFDPVHRKWNFLHQLEPGDLRTKFQYPSTKEQRALLRSPGRYAVDRNDLLEAAIFVLSSS